MKILTIVAMSFMAGCFIFSVAFAAGDAEKGKTLFDDPKLAGGTTGKSCSSCHPGGKGLDNVADKKTFVIMGKKKESLEATVNYFIETTMKGKALDPNSEEMANLIAYMKSLKK
jgi:cytochrome c553